jgi:hypothetical protein
MFGAAPDGFDSALLRSAILKWLILTPIPISFAPNPGG